MKNRFSRIFCILLFLLFVNFGVLSAQEPAPARLPGPWQDERFQERFIGTFGVRSDIEPSINRQEQTVLQEILPLMTQDPAGAASRLRQAIQPESSAALDFTLGNLYFQLDRLDDARLQYRNALRKFPDFMRAHKNLGLAAVRAGDFREGIASLSRSLELGGIDCDAYGVLGYAFLQLRQPLSAESAYRQAILFDPDNINWKLGLAKSLHLQQRHTEAAAIFAELLEQYPDRPDYWLFHANALMAKGESLRAAENLEVARRIGGVTFEVLLSLGEIYANENLPALAATRMIEAMEMEPGRSSARAVRVAGVLAHGGHVSDAVRVLDLLDQAHRDSLTPSDHAAFLRVRARIAYDQGDLTSARSSLEELVEANPLDWESHLLLARIFYAEGDVERAELVIEQAARIPEAAARAHRLHGELLVSQRRYVEALRHLRRAQLIEPREHIAGYLEQVERLAQDQQRF